MNNHYVKANSYFARARARARVALARILILWKIPNQTDFDLPAKSV